MSSASDLPQFTLKFVMVGDAEVGKTQLSARFCSDKYDSRYKPTERLQFSSKEFSFQDFKLKAQIWDTAGKDRPEGMTKAYFKDAVGAFLIYDVSNMKSFENVQKIWLPQVQAFSQPGTPIILIANKVDGPRPRLVDSNAGFALAAEHSCSYLEVAADTGYNVDVAFRRLIFSVAGILKEIKVLMDKSSLPTGWISLGEADDGNEEYCNYWTGETTSETPDEAALTYIRGTGNMDNFVKLELTFRDSFCNRIMNNSTISNNEMSNRDDSFNEKNSLNAATTENVSDISMKQSTTEQNPSACGKACVIS